MDNSPVVLFDGLCNFCNGAVNFIIKRDKKPVLKFASLQSRVAAGLLERRPLLVKDINSFVFIENNCIYTRSTAILKVCRYLSGLWPLMYGFIIVPQFLRDAIYNLVSKNRYDWFGKKEECMKPTEAIRARFLNE